MSRFTQRLLRLGPPITRDIVIEKNLRVPMRDGVELLADRLVPRSGGDSLPTALVRTPYGRKGPLAAAISRPLAERGYQVLMQSTRGTFGSGGDFDAFRQEREDGLATLEWIIEQPWFGGSIVLCGVSYLGYVQWAVADRLPPQVKAMIPQVTESALTLECLRADGFSLETSFGWGVMIAEQERRGAMLRQMRDMLLHYPKTARALKTLPLGKADVAALGRQSTYIQDILKHDRNSPRWEGIDHTSRVRHVTVPVSSVAGWYDIFLPGQLRDYRTLRSAGNPARLTVGPWAHISQGVLATGAAETLGFGLAHAHGEQPPDRAPVRLYVMGQEAWRDFESWPPEGYAAQRFHLQPGGGLSEQPPDDAIPTRFHYDPSHPTPAVGGIRMIVKAGRMNNAALEARDDVLTFTTAALPNDVEVIGEIGAEIWFRSSRPYADVFVRLCDVDTRGRSFNVCDGMVSLAGADKLTCATVQLWPTAYRFKRGHRIRTQVSSGAFPRYARNPGTGEPRATATRLHAADQYVYHDAAHPSAVILPVQREW
ncbi:CocE/NonD family hydrolase [Mycobacterium sp. OAE908]|uniref:CocE/NonD family hydrolase n=1 Tax=Mycobacterium sp. OAE908 TaxID=2817899 RepID=UPI001AE90966